MGRAKPQTDNLTEERLVTIKASSQSHKGAYDVALTTLFASSVSRKMHAAAYGADAALARSCEAKHQNDPSANTQLGTTRTSQYNL